MGTDREPSILQFFKNVFLFALRRWPRSLLPTIKNILTRPRNDLRDYFRAGRLASLWAGSNHYFLVILHKKDNLNFKIKMLKNFKISPFSAIWQTPVFLKWPTLYHPGIGRGRFCQKMCVFNNKRLNKQFKLNWMTIRAKLASCFLSGCYIHPDTVGFIFTITIKKIEGDCHN